MGIQSKFPLVQLFLDDQRNPSINSTSNCVSYEQRLRGGPCCSRMGIAIAHWCSTLLLLQGSMALEGRWPPRVNREQELSQPVAALAGAESQAVTCQYQQCAV